MLLTDVLVHKLSSSEKLAANRAAELGIGHRLRAAGAEMLNAALAKSSLLLSSCCDRLPGIILEGAHLGLALFQQLPQPYNLHLQPLFLHLRVPHLLCAHRGACADAQVQPALLHTHLLALQIQASDLGQLLNPSGHSLYCGPTAWLVRQAELRELHEVAF